ncbi:hypothetical protein GOP47_0025435 [Adiantum capillus-veneris]|uniref:Uncharacterized protein n=1 Tax=Adiantum capillus-veneris TaxID=13818 RepID=A0A9D4U2S1_ADICA|nr:hypothetical protein GOP47_0025435 [Adiantum capillus-veneris]
MLISSLVNYAYQRYRSLPESKKSVSCESSLITHPIVCLVQLTAVRGDFLLLLWQQEQITAEKVGAGCASLLALLASRLSTAEFVALRRFGPCSSISQSLGHL